ncbi:MAG: RidA family protein [Polyangiales bacterium]|nr:RidA family protein [Myxococcales bacterium]
MSRKPVSTTRAPAAIGPYSQAIQHGDWLFCSGQIALDPATGALVEGDVTAQTERVLENVAAVLEAAGVGFEAVVKTTIYLVDMNDFGAVNEVYARRFPGGAPPARSTVAVLALPRGARVEIEVTARV